MKKNRTLLLLLCLLMISGCTNPEQVAEKKELFPLQEIEYVEIIDSKNTLLSVHLEYTQYRNQISAIYSEMEKENSVDEIDDNQEQCYIVKFVMENDIHEFTVSEDTSELYETVKDAYQLHIQDMQ